MQEKLELKEKIKCLLNKLNNKNQQNQKKNQKNQLIN